MFGLKKRNTNTETKPPDADGPQYLSGVPLVIVFGSLCILSIEIVLYMTVISTATPSITTYFRSVEDVDWYSTAYLLALCAIQPLTGQIYTLFRVKFTFLAFIAVFELGTLVSALAGTSKAFIVGRAVAGLGAGGIFTGNMVMITVTAGPSIRPQLLSISVLMVGIGGVIGPVMGGAITEHLGWRWCLWIFLPFTTLIGFIFLIFIFPQQTEKAPFRQIIPRLHRELDLIGLALFVPACVMFLLAMSWGGSKYPWNSATIIALLVCSVITGFLFSWWIRYYKERALIPLNILLKRCVLWASIVSLTQGGSFLMVSYYLPLWFQSVKGANPEKGGVMVLPTCIAQIIAGSVCSVLLNVIPYAPIWTIGSCVVTAIGSGLMTTFVPSTTEGQWIGYQILSGVGRGIGMQMPIIAVQAMLPPTEIPIATASLVLFQYFGGSVVNCIAKTIFLNALPPAIEKYAPDVDAQKVIHAGATEVFKLIAPDDVRGVIKSYNEALALTFWLPTAAAIIGCFASFGLGWHKVGGKDEKKIVPEVIREEEEMQPDASGVTTGVNERKSRETV